MRRQRTIIEHGPRRLRLRPWRRVCRCGLGSWPCYAEQMLRRQAAASRPPNVRPGWDAPTTKLTPGPLMTRGQAARSRQGQRW